MRAAIKGIKYKAELTFTAYSIYKNGKQVEFNKDYNITSVDYITKKEIVKLAMVASNLKKLLEKEKKMIEVIEV